MEWTITGTESVTISQEKMDMRGRYTVHASFNHEADAHGRTRGAVIGYATTDAEALALGTKYLKRHAIEYKISREFVRVLREWLKPHEWKEMRKRNATISPGCCASHDFCDANMAMAEAWERHKMQPPCGLEQDATPQDHAREERNARIWGNAWELAMPRLGRKTS